MIYSMAKVKLTPKDRKSIVARVDAGEKQADVARDFDITQGYLSKIVKQSKINSTEIESSAKPVDLSDRTEEQLCNRYREIHREMIRHNGEVQQRLAEVDGLQLSIEAESQKDESVRDDVWILAQRQRLTWCLDTATTVYALIGLYQESVAILHAFVKRGVTLPYSISIFKALAPASKME